MTKKQKRFVEEYLIDLNATQAAIRAGYSSKTAQEQASRLLSNVMVQAAISTAQAERSRRTGISQDRVVCELAKIAFLNPMDVINMDEAAIREDADRDDTACIASVKVKSIPTKNGVITELEVKPCDKLKALELLGKHLGLFTDNVKMEGTQTIAGDVSLHRIDLSGITDEELDALDEIAGKILTE